MLSLKNIKYYQDHKYHPYNNTFRNNDEIRIPINNMENYTVPGFSRLMIEGTFKVAKKATAQAADQVTAKLNNNAIAHLFEQVRFELNGVEIDRTRHVGVTSTVKTLLTTNKEEQKGLKIAGWDFPIIEGENFYASVPLSMLLGFAHDFKDVLVRARQELILIRSRTDKNAYSFTAGGPDKADVTLTINKIVWLMPQVKYNLGPEKAILDKVKGNASFQIPFRSWETHVYPQLPNNNKETWKLMTTTNVEAPTYIIVIFSTDRIDNDRSISDNFDHVQLRSLKVHLNSITLPYENLDEDFQKDKYLNFYQNYLNFLTDFSDGERICEPTLSYADFKSENPIFVMKCLYADQIKPGGPLDIKIEMEASQNFPAKTSVFAILVHDVVFTYQSLLGIVRRMQ